MTIPKVMAKAITVPADVSAVNVSSTEDNKSVFGAKALQSAGIAAAENLTASSAKSSGNPITYKNNGNYSFVIEEIPNDKGEKQSKIVFTRAKGVDGKDEAKFEIKLNGFNKAGIGKLVGMFRDASDGFLGDLCAEIQAINFDSDWSTSYSDIDDTITLDKVGLDYGLLPTMLGQAVSNLNLYGKHNKNKQISFDILNQEYGNGIDDMKKDNKDVYSKENNYPELLATASTSNLYNECYSLLTTGFSYSQAILEKYFKSALLKVEKDLITTRELPHNRRNVFSKSGDIQAYGPAKSGITKGSLMLQGVAVKTETLKVGKLTLMTMNDGSDKTTLYSVNKKNEKQLEGYFNTEQILKDEKTLDELGF